jgi:hypothetical protein
VAHAFVHAGDLTVIASLAGAGDLAPGAPRTTKGLEEDASRRWWRRCCATYVELGAFRALPLPSAQGEIARSTPAHTSSCALAREDRLWNVRAQGRGERAARDV